MQVISAARHEGRLAAMPYGQLGHRVLHSMLPKRATPLHQETCALVCGTSTNVGDRSWLQRRLFEALGIGPAQVPPDPAPLVTLLFCPMLTFAA